MITLDILKKLFPTTASDILEDYVDPLNTLMNRYDITGRKRVASFLAQVGHESGGFRYRLENLNYSAQGLLKIFPKYFTAALAQKYARNPQAIASRVYANRMANGDEASGDGWRFRGRGILQITGRLNYTAFAKWMKISVDEAVVYLDTIEGAVMGAVWFWVTNGLNELADGDQITNITKKVNGGAHGLSDRKALWNKALTLL